MESIAEMLATDKMVLLYEAIGIVVFGGLDLFFGKKKKAAKLEEERAAIERQESQLRDSLSNARRR